MLFFNLMSFISLFSSFLLTYGNEETSKTTTLSTFSTRIQNSRNASHYSSSSSSSSPNSTLPSRSVSTLSTDMHTKLEDKTNSTPITYFANVSRSNSPSTITSSFSWTYTKVDGQESQIKTTSLRIQPTPEGRALFVNLTSTMSSPLLQEVTHYGTFTVSMLSPTRSVSYAEAFAAEHIEATQSIQSSLIFAKEMSTTKIATTQSILRSASEDSTVAINDSVSNISTTEIQQLTSSNILIKDTRSSNSNSLTEITPSTFWTQTDSLQTLEYTLTNSSVHSSFPKTSVVPLQTSSYDSVVTQVIKSNISPTETLNTNTESSVLVSSTANTTNSITVTTNSTAVTKNSTTATKNSTAKTANSTVATTITTTTAVDTTKKSTTRLVQGTIYCKEEKITDLLKGEYNFPKRTVYDKVNGLKCKYGGYIKQSRQCIEDLLSNNSGKWESLNLTGCHYRPDATNFQRSILNMNINSSTVIQVSESIAGLVKTNASIATKKDVDILISTLTKVLSTGSMEKKVVENVVDVVNSFSKLEESLIRGKDISDIEEIFQLIGSGFTGNILSVSNRNVGLSIKLIDRSPQKISIVTNKQSNMVIEITNTGQKQQEDATDSVSLPEEALKHVTSNTKLLVYSFTDLPIFPNTKPAKIVSKIISVNLMDNSIVENLQEPVQLLFSLQKKYLTKGELSCQYWDKKRGDWSKNGCSLTTKNTKASSVLCSCNHLTTFAVLYEEVVIYNEKQVDYENIAILIGSVIAVIGLGVTLITYLCVKTLRVIIYSKVIVRFCISLIFCIIALVGAITFTSRPLICNVFGHVLHYFILASFGWMLAQAVNLYRSIVVITVRRTDASYLRWMSIFIWAIPAVIVGVVVFFTRSSLREKNEMKICFVSELIFYFSVIAPTSVLILITFITFWPIFKNIIQTEELIIDSIMNRQRKDSKHAKATLVVDVALTILWLVALGAYCFGVDIMVYVFFALIPVFGVVVACVYVLCNKEGMQGFRDVLCCCGPDHSNETGERNEIVKLRKKVNLSEEDSKIAGKVLYGDSTKVKDEELKGLV